MSTVKRRLALKIAAIAAVSFSIMTVACDTFPESKFELAKTSRLPKWFQATDYGSRERLTVTLEYYIGLFGAHAVMTLRNDMGDNLMKVRLLVREKSADTAYPKLEVLSGYGIKDVVEHKRMEPLFYMVEK